MTDQFIPYEMAKMLKELKSNIKCYCSYIDSPDSGGHPTQTLVSNKNLDFLSDPDSIGVLDLVQAPLWQQIEQWLWDKHKLVICVDITNAHDRSCVYVVRSGETSGIILPEIVESSKSFKRFPSPITSKQEAIKDTIQYLFKQSQTK